MRITYDSQNKVAYIYLVEDIGVDGVAKTVPIYNDELNTDLVFDLDAEGRILGIEVLNAKGIAPDALDKAERN
jgi:uncharacterized protein YuzE